MRPSVLLSLMRHLSFTLCLFARLRCVGGLSMWKLLILIVVIVAGVFVVRRLMEESSEAADSYYGMPPSEAENQ
jgi:hypothetical protein